jgi:hypothetical protein
MHSNQGAMLTIEWRHLEVGGETCNRCAGTYGNIMEAITSLEKDHRLEGISIEVIDTPLAQDRIGESNLILINSIPLEQLADAGVWYTECASCSDLTGNATCCRAVSRGGATHETLPVEMIRDAILAAAKRMARPNHGSPED